MLRLLLAGFLIAHGLLHPAIYATPKQADEAGPFDPSHSWALAAVHVGEAPARALSVAIAWMAALGFILAGAVLLAGGGWWPAIAATAALAGLVLKLGYFHPWLTVGVLIDVGVLIAAIAGWPPSLV